MRGLLGIHVRCRALAIAPLLRQSPAGQAPLSNIRRTQRRQRPVLEEGNDISQRNHLRLPNGRVLLPDVASECARCVQAVARYNVDNIATALADTIEGIVDVEQIPNDGSVALPQTLRDKVALGVGRPAAVRFDDGEPLKACMQDIGYANGEGQKHVEYLAYKRAALSQHHQPGHGLAQNETPEQVFLEILAALHAHSAVRRVKVHPDTTRSLVHLRHRAMPHQRLPKDTRTPRGRPASRDAATCQSL